MQNFEKRPKISFSGIKGKKFDSFQGNSKKIDAILNTKNRSKCLINSRIINLFDFTKIRWSLIAR